QIGDRLVFRCHDGVHLLRVRTELASLAVDATLNSQGLTFLRAGALPPIPTRDQLCGVRMTFQGLTIQTTQFGAIPWFTIALSSLNMPDRLAAYAALHAAGDTHVGLAVSWNYQHNQGYSYPVPGRDLTTDLGTFR